MNPILLLLALSLPGSAAPTKATKSASILDDRRIFIGGKKINKTRIILANTGDFFAGVKKRESYISNYFKIMYLQRKEKSRYVNVDMENTDRLNKALLEISRIKPLKMPDHSNRKQKISKINGEIYISEPSTSFFYSKEHQDLAHGVQPSPVPIPNETPNSEPSSDQKIPKATSEIQPKPDPLKDFSAALDGTLPKRYLTDDKLLEEPPQSTQGFHPIRIVFDKSLLLMAIKKYAKPGTEKAINDKVISLLEKADSMLRKYLFVSDKAAPLSFGTELKCTEPRFFTNGRKKMLAKNGLKITGKDVLIYVSVFSNPNDTVVAFAKPCQKNNNNRVTLGLLALNIAKLKYLNVPIFDEIRQVMTIVHETFHIFAFNNLLVKSPHLKGAIAQPSLNYLKLFEGMKTSPIPDSQHWSPAFLPNDIMVPVSRIDGIISIFSLELVDNTSPEIFSSRKFLQNNISMDLIYDFKKYLSNPCEQTHLFCKDRTRPWGCDYSGLYKTQCDSTPLATNCRAKKPVISGVCIDPLNDKTKINKIEFYGDGSRCFETNKGDKSYCLKAQIEKNNLVIIAGGARYECKDGVKEVEINKVMIQCPQSIDTFNKNLERTNCPGFCHGNGICTDGKCQCFDGFDVDSHCRNKSKDKSILTSFIETLK